MSDSAILVIGACGQIGTELTMKLRDIYGNDKIIASDIKEGSNELMQNGIFEILDATYKGSILNIIKKHNVSEVYLMAAMVSVVAEKYPHRAWDLNMNSLLYVLELAQEGYLKKVFWPSSIAVFGKSTPNINTPQVTVTEPSTVYGISKLAGERWCAYYKAKYGIDVRSVRYPGIISWKTPPGGGTTDYAVEIYHKALEDGTYDCFLSENTRLPMMYMDDAIDATIGLMGADTLENFAAYNISATDFTPKEITESIRKHIPDFKITYSPDFRQQIADSWPQSIDDSQAQKDWNWKPNFDLEKITQVMLGNLKSMYNSK
ncbi:NAD-dependent epimerase/dehydratase family protein [Aureibaculum sp. 2210JD6-5]|uniref:NAD-dependent epimerase/dehydratase family protein n=1 Tax=Aureibaculum sp. 2210JD6-5 TaxID=3103957 RepID=UPI002AACE445|nr:NAD-dependent epimerase/dehydratase family protein [Aureibaculum sp. 2210JD6-5]MDY7394940.1 NAD-dependent epimerase/dehydratase family protein [Aureibaculum sp. 2210JD6-5]